jgi:hypothetical protein
MNRPALALPSMPEALRLVEAIHAPQLFTAYPVARQAIGSLGKQSD